MEFNGNLQILGDSDFGVVLSGVAAGTATGQDGENKKGILTFSNGFKIQWDTVALSGDTATVITLASAYTGRQLFVIASYGSDIDDSSNESSIAAFLSDSPDQDSKVNLKHNNNTTENVTYISFGFDV